MNKINKNNIKITKTKISEKSQSPKKSKSFVYFILAGVIMLSVASFLAFNYIQAQADSKINKDKKGEVPLSNFDTKSLLNKVNRHLTLPSDEEPMVASITNIDNLIKTQPFYKGAKNGDKVIVYIKNQKALIYDEQKDVLVNVGPVYVDPENNVQTNVEPAATNTPVNNKQNGQ